MHKGKKVLRCDTFNVTFWNMNFTSGRKCIHVCIHVLKYYTKKYNIMDEYREFAWILSFTCTDYAPIRRWSLFFADVRVSSV